MPFRPHADWLLLYATPGEAAHVHSALTGIRTTTIAGLRFTQGRAGRQRVVAVATGIGQANAAFAAGVALAAFNVKQVLNFGIAGGYRQDDWQIGEVARGTIFGLGDEGVSGPGGWQDLGAIGIPLIAQSKNRSTRCAAFNRIPVQPVALSRTSLRNFSESHMSIRSAGILTVATCSGTGTRAQTMRRRAAGLAAHASESRLPWVEDMETAAIALACVRAGKTLLALRGISNQAGDRNKSRWDIPAAARAAQAAAWLAVTGRELESLGGNSRS